MIWVIRIVAMLLLLFFLGPLVYFVITRDWVYALNSAFALIMTVNGWAWLEERNNRGS